MILMILMIFNKIEIFFIIKYNIKYNIFNNGLQKSRLYVFN
jgi:hypothetical protein